MKKLGIGLCFIVLVVNAGSGQAQSNDPVRPDSPSPSRVASLTKTAPWCDTAAKFDARFAQLTQDTAAAETDVGGPSSTGSGVLVVEDMHCRQCHGKCEADNLRCRSQCLNDTTCLDHCEARSTKCTGMCKELFQCQ